MSSPRSPGERSRGRQSQSMEARERIQSSPDIPNGPSVTRHHPDPRASAHARMESAFVDPSGSRRNGSGSVRSRTQSAFGSSHGRSSYPAPGDDEKPKSMFARSVFNAAKNRASQNAQSRPTDEPDADASDYSSDESSVSPDTNHRAVVSTEHTPPRMPAMADTTQSSSRQNQGNKDDDDEGEERSEYHDKTMAPPARIIGSASPENFSRELHRALSNAAWTDMYQILLELQDQPNFVVPALTLPGADRATVLHVSAWKAPQALTKFLIADVAGHRKAPNICMARDADGNTPLHLCAANLDESLLGKLDISLLKCLVLNAPRALQVENAQGDTPLHLLVSSSACCKKTSAFALEAAAEAAVSAMLDASVDVAVMQDNTGATPLHVAIAHGAHERVLMRLLETSPAAAQVQDDQGMLPLHYLAAFGCSSYSVMKALVESYPAAILHVTTNGDTSLHLLATNASSLLSDNATLDRNASRLVEFLTGNDQMYEQAKYPVVVTNGDQLNPLHCCTLFSTPPKLVSLMAKGPGATEAFAMSNAFGATPLHMLCAQPNVGDLMDIVFLFATPEAVVAVDRLKRTPLHVAAQNSRAPSQLIKELVRLYPDATSMRTQRGHLALHLAAQSQVKDSVVKALIRANPEAAEVRNKSDNTPLHDAAKYQASPGVVKLLLNAYPDAVFIQNQYGNLPLHCATAYQAGPQVIELLLAAWSDGASMQNKSQDAPLHYAAAHLTSCSTVMALVDAAPAAVLLSNSSGQTPIDKAKENSAPSDIIDLLEESAYQWTKKASADGWGTFGGGQS